jgi:hypothetical protein
MIGPILQRGSQLVLGIQVDRGSLSTDHELASHHQHQMPMFDFRLLDAVFIMADIIN